MSKNFYLLRSQKNAIYEEILRLKMKPSEFEWQEVVSPRFPATGHKVSKLVQGPEYYFLFDNAEDVCFSEWCPDDEKFIGSRTSNVIWEKQFQNCKDWLSYLQRETESPNLWEAIAQESQIISAASLADLNTTFTKEEKEYIHSGIEEIKQYLLTAHKIDPELVESRLNYLAEASERVGRKDWINLLLSVLIGIVVAAALPPETTREVFRFVGQVLKNVLHQPILLM